MSESSASRPVNLVNAIMRVCDPRLIKAVCDVEPWQSDEVLLATGVPRLIQQREEPDPYEQADQARSFQTAWQMLLQDFLTRVGRGEVFLEGVLIHPNPNTTPEPIPHVWAADIRLGVASGAAEVAGRRYVSVQVRFERPMPDTEHVSLFDALLRSADPSLLEAVRQAERRHLAHELQEFYRKSKGGRRQLIDDGEAQVPSSGSWTGGASLTPLSVAWIKLVAAFRADFEQGRRFLNGVQLEPEPSSDRISIPGELVAEFEFDFLRNTIALRNRRFGTIRVSHSQPDAPQLGRPAAAVVPSATPTPFATNETGLYVLQPSDVAGLSDDTLLALLEEHARRVIGTNDARLIAPGKISFLPIIRRKMMARADAGELAPTITAEAAFLEQWINSKIDHHQTPTAGTIGKVLGLEYGLQKPRSNAANQQSDAANQKSDR